MKKNKLTLLITICVFAINFYSCDKNDEIEEKVYDLHSIKIQSLQHIEDKNLFLGEAPDLPIEVGIFLENEEVDTVPIKWNGYFNPMVEGEYELKGEIITEHKPYIIPHENVVVKLSVNSRPNSHILNGYDKKNSLMGVGEIYSEDWKVRSAIKRDLALVKETILDKYEVLIRFIQSDNELKEYQDSTLMMKNCNWEQMNQILGSYSTDSTCNNLIPPLEDDYAILNITVVYRYALHEVVGNVVITDEARELFEENPEFFKKEYGKEYVSKVTLGYCWVVNKLYKKTIDYSPDFAAVQMARIIKQINGRKVDLQKIDSQNKAPLLLHKISSNYFNTFLPFIDAMNYNDYLVGMKNYVSEDANARYEEMYTEYSNYPLK